MSAFEVILWRGLHVKHRSKAAPPFADVTVQEAAASTSCHVLIFVRTNGTELLLIAEFLNVSSPVVVSCLPLLSGTSISPPSSRARAGQTLPETTPTTDRGVLASQVFVVGVHCFTESVVPRRRSVHHLSRVPCVLTSHDRSLFPVL